MTFQSIRRELVEWRCKFQIHNIQPALIVFHSMTRLFKDCVQTFFRIMTDDNLTVIQFSKRLAHVLSLVANRNCHTCTLCERGRWGILANWNIRKSLFKSAYVLWLSLPVLNECNLREGLVAWIWIVWMKPRAGGCRIILSSVDRSIEERRSEKQEQFKIQLKKKKKKRANVNFRIKINLDIFRRLFTWSTCSNAYGLIYFRSANQNFCLSLFSHTFPFVVVCLCQPNIIQQIEENWMVSSKPNDEEYWWWKIELWNYFDFFAFVANRL